MCLLRELSLTDKIAQSLAVSNSEAPATPMTTPLESPFIAMLKWRSDRLVLLTKL